MDKLKVKQPFPYSAKTAAGRKKNPASLYPNLIIFIALAFLPCFSSIYYSGEIREFFQPDGSIIKVKLYGSYPVIYGESVDGYALVRDRDGWYCYADLNPDATRLVPGSERYRGPGFFSPTRKKHLRRKASVDMELIDAYSLQLRESAQKKQNRPSALKKGSAAAAENINLYPHPSGIVDGLVLLVNFPDRSGAHSAQEIDDWLNKEGYTDHGCNGSVRDFYLDVSNGQFDYRLEVPQYYTAQYNFSYYDGFSPRMSGAKTLIEHALAGMDPFVDFSLYDNDNDGWVDALNVVYAGRASDWDGGLWPHRGWYGGSQRYDGVRIGDYQITDSPDRLGLYVFCHETGHLMFGWPDCYGTGDQGLMGSRPDDYNPVPPSDVFRADQGWIDIVDLDVNSSGTFQAVANDNIVYRYQNPGRAGEYFLWTNRKNTGRWDVLRGRGLLIYHFDRDIRSNNPPNTLCLAVEQADGLDELGAVQWPRPGSDPDDFFFAGNQSSFTPTTSPDSRWNGGASSGLTITNISDIADIMTFTVGTGGSPLRMLTVINGSGDGYYNEDDVVPITADEPPFNQVFKEWTGDIEGIADIYAPSTTISIGSVSVAVKATYSGIPFNGIILPQGTGHSVTVSDTLFYDDGGPDYDYSNNFYSEITFLPRFNGQKIKIEFLEFEMEVISQETIWDSLVIYNGNSTSVEPLGLFYGEENPGSFTSTSADGSLTIKFRSDEAVQGLGWKARITAVGTADIIAPDAGQRNSLPEAFGLKASGPGIFFEVPPSKGKEPSFVKISIYNTSGELLDIPFHGPAEPGRHSFELEKLKTGPGQTSSSLVFCRMESAGFDKTVPLFISGSF